MKTIFYTFLLIVFLIGVSNVANMAERSNGIPDVFTRLFPERFMDEQDKEDLQAMETGMAPFAAAENAANPEQIDPDIEYDPLGGSLVLSEALHIPHRNEAAVSAWIVEYMSKILTFRLVDWNAHQQQITALMGATAIKELNAFMGETNILALMQSKDYELRSFVSDVPELVTSGVVADRYRWAYDVPVNLTFLPNGKANYEEMKKDEYRNEIITFRIQIGRVGEGGTEGMIIETWDTVVRKKKE